MHQPQDWPVDVHHGFAGVGRGLWGLSFWVLEQYYPNNLPVSSGMETNTHTTYAIKTLDADVAALKTASAKNTNGKEETGDEKRNAEKRHANNAQKLRQKRGTTHKRG